jgi:hypothetical protein
MSADIKELIRQNISPFIQGPEIDALINAIELEAIRQKEFSIASFNQLFLSTASGEYLARKASEEGITQPDVLGIEDFLFRDLAITATASKQVATIIHDILEVFYGPDVTRAFIRGDIAGPFDLTNPSNPNIEQYLKFNIDGKSIYYEVNEDDYPNGNIITAPATAVASALTKAIRSQGSNGYADVDKDPNTGAEHIRIFSGAKGPTSYVQMVGGDLIRILGLPQTTPIVDLQPPNPPSTAWQITKNGNNVRFLFQSGSNPFFIRIGDDYKAHLFGSQFQTYDLLGSFKVVDVQQGLAGIGYFEIEAPGAKIPGGIALITQSAETDITFSRTPISRPNYRKRFALGWQAASQELKIYLPAVTRVIRRDLEGSAHMHLLKSTSTFNNKSYGSSVKDKDKLKVISPLSFSFTPRDYEADILAFNGELSVPYSNLKDYQTNTIVSSGGLFYKAIQPSGPNFGGAKPVTNLSYWIPSATGAAIDYIRRDGGRVIVVMKPNSPHGLSFNPVTKLSNEIVTITNVSVVEDDQANPFVGAYIYDPEARYVLTGVESFLEQEVLAGNSYSLLDVSSSAGFPNTKAVAAFAFGTDREEYPVPLIGTLSGRLRVDPSYKFKFSHPAKPANWSQTATYSVGNEVFYKNNIYRSKVSGNTGNVPEDGPIWENRGVATLITLLSSASPIELDPFGKDYAFYVTGTADARNYVRDLLEKKISALGIKLRIVIVYPNGIGIGNGLEPTDASSYDFGAITVPKESSTYKLNDLIYSYSPSTEDQV